MGSDSAKTHEAFTVAPAEPARPSDAVDVRDDRPAGSTPLHLDADALDTALAAVGVTVGPDTLVKVRLRPQQFPGQHGSAQRIGPDAYRVVIHVADKPTFKNRHLYVVNNSLLHELRHVAQIQHDPDHASHYANENLTVGYERTSTRSRPATTAASPTTPARRTPAPQATQKDGRSGPFVRNDARRASSRVRLQAVTLACHRHGGAPWRRRRRTRHLW